MHVQFERADSAWLLRFTKRIYCLPSMHELNIVFWEGSLGKQPLKLAVYMRAVLSAQTMLLGIGYTDQNPRNLDRHMPVNLVTLIGAKHCISGNSGHAHKL